MFNTQTIAKILPGILVCIVVALVAYAVQAIELALIGRVWIDSIIIALLLGLVARSILGIHERFRAGVGFAAKQLLEFAVMLLGATISIHTLLETGIGLVSSIAVIVFISIIVSYSIARTLGLSQSLSLLIACGNSICGNSAIVAVASVIKAEPKEVASAIAFTAILGIIVVLSLPLVFYYGVLGEYEYGLLAGLTVYAVPQVLAATVPVGIASMQIAAFVKLVRVLMLGPVIISISLLQGIGQPKLKFGKLIPWFVSGFVVLALVRSIGLLPEWTVNSIGDVTKTLTIISMAAMGLSIDVKDIRSSALRVSVAVMLSLSALMLISFGYLTYLYPLLK